MSRSPSEAAIRRTGAAIAFAVLCASPVLAASAPAQMTSLVVPQLTMTKTVDLDFGRIISRTTANRVTINATTGARTASLGVTSLAPGAPFTRALFQLTGAPGYVARITLPGTTTLTRSGGGATMTVTTWRATTTAGLITLNAAGQYVLGVGARLNVGANQAPGVYTGTFTVTANYQ
jgi:Mat/Ecp fimbriae major subunit